MALAAASVFLFRRRRNERGENGYKSWGHPLTTCLFIAVQVAVSINLFYRSPINSMIGAGIALTGIPVYLIWRRLGAD